MSDGPLVIIIIGWFLKFLAYCSALVAAPTTLYLQLCRVLLKKKESMNQSSGLYLFLWFPRWFVLTFAFPFWIGQGALMWLLLDLLFGFLIGILCAISFLGVTVVGLVVTRRLGFLKRKVPKLPLGGSDGYFAMLGQSQVDMLAFFAFLITIAGVIRIPALILVIINGKDNPLSKDTSMRTALFLQLGLTFVDWLLVPVLVLHCIVFWRFWTTIPAWKEKSKDWDMLLFVHSMRVRWVLITSVLQGLVDIPCFALCIFFVLAPWRIPVVADKMKIDKTINQRRVTVLKQFGHAFVDLLCVMPGIFVCLSLYRALPMLRAISVKDLRATCRRKAPFIQAGMIFFDVFLLFCMPLLLLTVYRVPVAWRKTREKAWCFSFVDAPSGASQEKKIEWTEAAGQKALLRQVGQIFVDIPFILMGFLITVLVWRTYLFWKAFVNARKDHPHSKVVPARRQVCLKQFGLLYLDVLFTFLALIIFLLFWWRIYHLVKDVTRKDAKGSDRRRAIWHHCWNGLVDIPFLFMGLVVTLLLWRAYFMWAKIVEADKATKRRKAAWKHFWNLFPDIPCILMGVIVCCLLYRIYWLAQDLKKAKNAPYSRVRKARWAATKHFLFLFVDIIDIPFAILAVIIVLTGWRSVALYRGLKPKTTRNGHRWVVIQQALFWLLDIPTFIAFFFVAVTVYRMRKGGLWTELWSYWADHKKEADGAPSAPIPLPVVQADDIDEESPVPVQKKKRFLTWHTLVWYHFGLLMLDIPFPLLAIFSLWRFPLLVRRLWKECDTAMERRLMVLKYLLLVVRDIPCSVLVLFTFICVWRIPSFIRMCKTYEKGDNEHWLFLKFFLQVLIDLPFAILAIWVTVAFWRMPFFWKHIITMDGDAPKRRIRVAEYAGFAVCDIFYFILTFFCFFFAWRCGTFISDLKQNHQPIQVSHWAQTWSWYRAARHTVGCILKDLPFVFLGIVASLFLWRTIFIWRNIFFQCDSAAKRRKRAAQYFGFCWLDVLFFFTTALTVLFVWRIPTLKLQVKFEYARLRPESHWRITQAWYSGTLITLGKALLDFPFVIMGFMICCLCWWRALFFLVHVFKKCKEDTDRRKMTAQYFGMFFADLFCITLMLFNIMMFWRLPTYRFVFKYFMDDDHLASWTGQQSHWKFSFSFYQATLKTWALGVLDLLSLIQILVILVTVLHTANFLTRVHRLTKMYCLFEKDQTKQQEVQKTLAEAKEARILEEREREALSKPVEQKEKAESGSEDSGDPDEPVEPERKELPMDDSQKKNLILKETFRNYQEGYSHKVAEEFSHSPLSLSLYRKLVTSDCVDALHHFPHLFLLPFKILGLLALPGHLFVGKRIKGKGDHSSLSFIKAPLKWLHDISEPRKTFWGLHEFFILNGTLLLVILPNELALLPAICNMLLLSIITLGSPLWRKYSEKAGWRILGTAPPSVLWQALEGALLVLQVLLVPVFFLIQIPLPLLPFIILGIFRFGGSFANDLLSFCEYFFSAEFWESVGWGYYVLAFFWIIILVAGWQITFKQTKHFLPLFDPLNAYFWLGKRIVAGTLFKGYKAILANITQWAYAHRRSFCWIGEWVMFPAFVFWAGWPLIIPPLIPNYWVFLGAAPVAIFLSWIGRIVVKKNWKQRDLTLGMAGINLTRISGSFPESGGVKIDIAGTKDPLLVVTQAMLRVEGDAFWRAVDKIVDQPYKRRLLSTFKLIFYPVKLCPDFLDKDQIRQGSTNVSVQVKFGTEGRFQVKKKLVMRYIKKLIKEGNDPEFTVVIDFGKKSFRWQKYGTLCQFTSKMSDIFNALEKGIDLLHPDAEPEDKQLSEPEIQSDDVILQFPEGTQDAQLEKDDASGGKAEVEVPDKEKTSSDAPEEGIIICPACSFKNLLELQKETCVMCNKSLFD